MILIGRGLDLKTCERRGSEKRSDKETNRGRKKRNREEEEGLGSELKVNPVRF